MSNLKRKLWLFGFLTGALSGCTAFGSTITTLTDIFSNTSDASPMASGAGVDRVDMSTVVVGRTSSMTYDECGVLVFSLATIPAGYHVVSATVGFLAVKSSPSFDVDLYGIGLRDSATVLTSDYSAQGELIKESVLVKDGTYAANQFQTLSDTALVDYINNQLATVISNGYLFLRFSADGPISAGQYYQIGTGNLTSNKSYLRLTIAEGSPTVPEAGTLALLGIGAAILLFGPHRGK